MSVRYILFENNKTGHASPHSGKAQVRVMVNEAIINLRRYGKKYLVSFVYQANKLQYP